MHHQLHSHVLQLDIQGTPQAWISLEHAAVHVATGSVAWVDGCGPLATLRGGFNVVRGRQSVIDVSYNVFANLGWDEVRLPNPVFEGDTIYSRSTVLDKRESKSRPNLGVVTVATEGFNQEAVVVCTFKRTLMVYKRGMAPNRAPPVPGSKP